MDAKLQKLLGQLETSLGSFVKKQPIQNKDNSEFDGIQVQILFDLVLLLEQ